MATWQVLLVIAKFRSSILAHLILFTPAFEPLSAFIKRSSHLTRPAYAISPTIRPSSERPKIIHPVHERPSNLPASRLRCRSSKNHCANMSGRFAASNPPKQTALNTSTKGNIVQFFSTHAKFFPAFGLTIHKTAVLCGNPLEARVGIEPTNEGFADLSLPTWVPRLGRTV